MTKISGSRQEIRDVSYAHQSQNTKSLKQYAICINPVAGYTDDPIDDIVKWLYDNCTAPFVVCKTHRTEIGRFYSQNDKDLFNNGLYDPDECPLGLD
jgi:hypothetical protein